MQPLVIREAPTPEPLTCGVKDPAFPAVPAEPPLHVENIQGNILTGFNKDHQILLFLEIRNARIFKEWLKTQINFIATAAEVIAFNRLFRATRKRRGAEGTVKATWTNVAFTFTGLEHLQVAGLNEFKDPAFTAGLAARAHLLGDHGPGAPEKWVVGGTKNERVDVVLIVAADDRCDMLAEVDRIERSIADFHSGGVHEWVRIVFHDEGANLPPPLAGHEHFGFLDGVSQPGLRGRASDDPTDVITLRQNPDEPDDQGKPGQDLLWPGEFIFGYPGQDAGKEVSEPGPDSLRAAGPGGTPVGPEWAQDGSYLVFRRLHQDVGGFHTFLKETAAGLGVADPGNSSGARLVGARMVGRWPSGAPVVREPDQENQAMADDDCANNHFEFQGAAPNPPAPPLSPLQCQDSFPPSPADPPGLRCPFTGHIRKSYPRDDEPNPAIPPPPQDPGNARARLNESDTQTHRLLRRGIPYGPVARSTPESPFFDKVDRGLHFLAYQTSIEDQFEFVIRGWVNNADFKEAFNPAEPDAAKRGGHDPVIGQNPNGPREFTITFPDAASPGGVRRVRVTTDVDWVIPTGGGYYFAPSIAALKTIAGP